jgi:type 1 glutamine amidotransferase
LLIGAAGYRVPVVPTTRAAAVLVLAVAAALLGGSSSRGAPAPPELRILLFTKTAGFRHDSLPTAVEMLRELGARNRVGVDATEDAAVFTDQRLRRYDVVVFLLTTGDVLDDSGQAAFQRYIRSGGGFAGVHSASDTEHDWPWYGGLVGAYFRDHPGVPGVNQQFQTATMKVAGFSNPANVLLPNRWTRVEEWYNFRTNPRPNVRVLVTVDEKTYDPRGYSVPGGSPGMGEDHPISWCHPYDGGRAFYTALGHSASAYSEPLVLAHILGGIEETAGVAKFNCS